MALVAHTIAEVTELAEQFRHVHDRLLALCKEANELSMPVIEFHDGAMRSIHWPYVEGWIDKTEIQVKAQIRAWIAGQESRSVKQRRWNASRPPKQASAPPPSDLPVKKPAAKRKTKGNQ